MMWIKYLEMHKNTFPGVPGKLEGPRRPMDILIDMDYCTRARVPREHECKGGLALYKSDSWCVAFLASHKRYVVMRHSET
jgi:hypothetical protein